MAPNLADWVGQRLSGGRYEILAKLGEGGMGFVYRAHDENLATDVVIKVPRPHLMQQAGFAERFSREIRSLVRLAHPHICRLNDVGQHDGLPFAVMQFLAGGSVEDRRAKNDKGQFLPVPVADVTFWLEDVSKALDFMHRQGYIHRDVKPHNILFDGDGNVYLSDFGLAKVLAEQGHDPTTMHLTMTGMMIGTPHYMSPELLKNKDYDGRSDQYALAVTVFELLTGRMPLDGATAAMIISAHLTDPPKNILELRPDLSPEVSSVLMKGLSKNPAERYPDCLTFARCLIISLHGQPGSASSSGVMMAGHTPGWAGGTLVTGGSGATPTGVPYGGSLVTPGRSPSEADTLPMRHTPAESSRATARMSHWSDGGQPKRRPVAMTLLVLSALAAAGSIGYRQWKHMQLQPAVGPEHDPQVAAVDPAKQLPQVEEPAKPEPAKPEPPKPEPKQPEPAKTPDPQNKLPVAVVPGVGDTKPEPPVKPEPSKPEPPAPEPSKPEPVKPQPMPPPMPLPPVIPPAVYAVTLEPPDAELTVDDPQAQITRDGAVRRIQVPKPDGTRSLKLRVSATDFTPDERTLTPKAGASESLAIELKPLPPLPTVFRLDVQPAAANVTATLVGAPRAGQQNLSPQELTLQAIASKSMALAGGGAQRTLTISLPRTLPKGVEAKEVELRAELQGYKPLTKRVQSKPGDNSTIKLMLEPLPATVQLTVDPASAKVATTASVGVAGTGAQRTLTVDLPDGAIEVQITADGYQPKLQKIEVLPGQQQSLKVQLDPLPAVFAIRVMPETARVLVEGGKVVADGGLRTITFDRPNGVQQYTVSILNDGYKAIAQPLVPKPGEQRAIVVELMPLGVVVNLEINPPDATVTVSRTGAQVLGDGAERKVTLPASAADQDLEITVTHPSYKPLKQTIKPKAGEEKTYKLELSSIPAVYTLSVAPADARVVIIGPGTVSGTGTKRLLTINVPDGRTRIEVVASHADYEPTTRIITPKSGDQRTIPLQLIPKTTKK